MRYPGKVIFEFMEPLPAGMDKKTFMSELQKRIEGKCAELNAETIKNISLFIDTSVFKFDNIVNNSLCT